MATNLVKPSAAGLADPAQALLIVLRLFEAVQALQQAAGQSSPESMADKVGTSEIVVLRGATVTLPGSSVTFTADVFGWGIKV